MRQVPDNQEVYVSSDTETSVVIEVLAMVEEGSASTDLWEAIKSVNQWNIHIIFPSFHLEGLVSSWLLVIVIVTVTVTDVVL